MRRAATVFVLLLLLGCGISEVGERDLLVDGSTADVAVDVVNDVKEEPFVCNDAGTASCADAVAFRSPALFSPDAGAPCPSGYETHDLVLALPNKPTCSCTCTDNGAASCDTTLVSYKYGVGNCNTGSGSYALNGCTTTNQPTFTGESVEVDPPKVTGGCGGGTSVVPPSTSTNVRLCTPQCASDERVCSQQTGLRACVSVVGSVGSCPANYPSGPFYIGTSPSLTCDTCGCVQTGDCTSSVDNLFTDTGCGTTGQAFVMDGQCHALGASQINQFRSAQITPVIKAAACNVSEGAAHVTYGGDDFTVCCQ